MQHRELITRLAVLCLTREHHIWISHVVYFNDIPHIWMFPWSCCYPLDYSKLYFLGLSATSFWWSSALVYFLVPLWDICIYLNPINVIGLDKITIIFKVQMGFDPNCMTLLAEAQKRLWVWLAIIIITQWTSPTVTLWK